MALTLTPPPGTYTAPQTITVTGPSDVTGIIVTSDGKDPVVVKTVASSNKYAPAEYPYVQTIEDGRGRAVFDGAFTKYYNAYWNDPSNASGNPTSFAQLSPSFQFLYNAWNFLLKPGGGKRILILGDKYLGGDDSGNDDYLVKTTNEDCWYTAMMGLSGLMGFSLTIIKDSSDYAGNMLNPTYAECMNYDIIMLFSSAVDISSGRTYLTNAGAANIAQARRDGVGVYICTDNGGGASGDPNTRYPEAFYATANILVAAMVDANFQGNMDFTPGTTVGYNKAKWGDSPLFDNIADTGIVGASTSDSFVNQVVTTNIPLPTTVNAGAGYTTFKFAVTHTDGSVTFEQYGYNVGEPPLVELSDSAGNTISAWPETNLHGRDSYFKYVPSSTLTGNGSGFVMVGTQVIGEFNDNGAGLITVSWLTTPYTPTGTNNIYMPGIQNNSVKVSLTLPVVFDFVFPFNRFVPTATPTDKDGGPFVSQINRNEFAGNSLAQVLQKAIAQLPVTPQPKDDKSRTLTAVYTRMTT